MRLFRVDENTRFHIDYTWFEKNGQDVNILIRKYLSPEQLEQYTRDQLDETFDFVDPDTAEVHHITRAAYLVRAEMQHNPNFLHQGLPIAEAVFRIFLVNNNQPLTVAELAAYLNRRPADVIAQIGGRNVYNGIRPIRN
ncbi:MAG: hypothetical protein ACK4WM_01070 [Thermoflexales bacterium]